jgi:glucokinase
MSDQNGRVLVYDVGGSHISAAVFHNESCALSNVVSAGYPAEQTVATFLDVLESLATQASSRETGILGAGLAMPGPFDYDAGVSWMEHKLPYLYAVDLRAAFAARRGWQPGQVRFLNDAAAYLLGEVRAGAARNVARAVVITLGTGIGSGFAVNGEVVRSGTGVPPGGEIWNLPFAGGIIEDQVSTRALQASYKQRTGNDSEVSAIAAAAATDPLAAAVFSDFGHHLGEALRAVVSDFAPQVVVLGGGISRSAQLFVPAAQQELEGLGIELRIAQLMDNAPLTGAGAAWFAAKA